MASTMRAAWQRSTAHERLVALAGAIEWILDQAA